MSGILNPIQGVIYHKPENAGKWKQSGAWINETVGNSLRIIARQMPDKLAFISDERNVSFQELDEQTERLAAALLGLGLKTGDRAIFQLGTNIETILTVVACFKAGIVPVCSLPQHREVEIGQLARQSGAKGYFVQADVSPNFDLVAFAQKMVAQSDSLDTLVVIREEDQSLPNITALIDSIDFPTAKAKMADVKIGIEDVLSFQLSGGTTGVPKIIPRFHAEYLGHTLGWMRTYGIHADSRVIWCLSLLHNAGQIYSLISVISFGVSAVIMPKVDIKRMLELIETHHVTHALSIGPIAPQLMAYEEIGKHDLSSLELFCTMCRADTLEQHLGVPCSNLYGITEGLLLGSGAGDSAFQRHHSQGVSGCTEDEIRLLDPGSEQEVRLGEMGELCFRGPSTLPGFFDAPEVTASSFTADGFYRTGDMVTAHEVEGGKFCYTFEGRLRDNINRGGEKIGCEEVEAFVCKHPSISDAKLVAMPDPIYGEKGCIFIIPHANREVPDVKVLATFLIEQGLAKYKCPERIEIITEFPVTKVGKLNKPELKQMITEKLRAEQVIE
ncbi:AMP-binding protein [Acinetobacter dispersus]|uniref:(2,3-dihydroxybenzoyl)adenylate synthase n=1 Tax=Acinetobacter dispersus TaxID=70348 RepID=N9LG33_9GAMM|nr:AMP-binding protein [Acinetobacter dispersus]ENW95193.1 hypothetical protein F904_00484 [Acinetobacter dispersus]